MVPIYSKVLLDQTINYTEVRRFILSKSIEEKVEDYYKNLFDELGIPRYTKTQAHQDNDRAVMEAYGSS